MASIIQLRRGTTTQHNTFTGSNGEVTVDTTKKTVVVHDGATAGGTPLAKESALASYLLSSTAASTYAPLASPAFSGNVGIGTSSPGNKLHVSGGSSNTYIQVTGASSDAYLGVDSGGVWLGTTAVIPIRFLTNNIERGRVDSGGAFYWNTTANLDTVSYLNLQVKGGIAIDTNNTGPQTAMSFFNGQGTGTRVGWIGTSGSSTSFNTSSDERLKENIEDADAAGDLIDSIQVRKFDWKLNGEHQRYGMIAQELDEVFPEAVAHGPTEDDMMAVDYSKLVPMMLKELQALRARVAELEAA